MQSKAQPTTPSIGRAHRDIQDAICIAVIQSSGYSQVADLLFRLEQQHYRTENTAQIPHVLIFKVAAITKTQHDQFERICTCPQYVSKIELRGQTTVLGIAYPLAVTPKMESTVDAAKNYPHLLLQLLGI